MATLRQTVASVVAQVGVGVEHVFVDGGSDDGTLAYIGTLDHGVRVVRDEGRGIAAAMNLGAAAARGRYVCHLHSDDYFLHPQVLRRVAAHFEQSGAQWLFGRILSDIDGALVPEQYRVPEYSYQRLLRRNFIPHPATFVRREVFERCGGFDEQYRFAMDYDFFLRIARVHPPLALREAFSVFRRHDGSTTQRNRLRSFEEDHAVRLRHIGPGRLARLPHQLRYLVRRRRLLAALGEGAA